MFQIFLNSQVQQFYIKFDINIFSNEFNFLLFLSSLVYWKSVYDQSAFPNSNPCADNGITGLLFPPTSSLWPAQKLLSAIVLDWVGWLLFFLPMPNQTCYQKRQAQPAHQLTALILKKKNQLTAAHSFPTQAHELPLANRCQVRKLEAK